PVNHVVKDLIDSGVTIHCLRDLTRGGLSSALIEIAESRGLTIHINEQAIPVREDVRGACEMLGFDPLYVANEGRFVAIVAPEHADTALEVMKKHEVCEEAAIIGEVTNEEAGRVTMTSRIGTKRIVDMLSGEQLPRIC
ncbi:MAG: hydrogenase expression/formation protein HypE, partial [Calditrichaeota bacterium]